MKCEKCNYSTENLKSFSNHIRYGCKIEKRSELTCKQCQKQMPKRKPSEQGYFCNNLCYGKWRSENKSGKNSKLYKTGESRTRLYFIWLGMKRRCYKSNSKDYKNYGGRGIFVSEKWINDFIEFKKWAYNNGYKENLTIERKNVNDGYNEENCTWIIINEQSKNRRNVKIR